MSIEKLQRQLAHDLKRNPKKAAMLALLAVVCVWFWIPLIFKHDPLSAAPPVSAAVPGPVQTMAAVPGAAPPAAPGEVVASWQELDRQITSDPQMQPADLSPLAAARNPFGMAEVIAEQKRVALAEEQSKQQDEPEAAPPAESTPEQAGLTLSSTMIGTNKCAALINGRVYEEGAPVVADDGSKFILTQVEAQRVILERDGQDYPLKIKRRTKSGRAEIHAIEP